MRENAVQQREKIAHTALKVVAVLFILSGISSLIGVIVALTQSRLSINFGVLGLFIGPGLLRLSPAWRTWALVFTWLALVGAPLGVLLFLATPGSLDFKLFGQTVGQLSKTVAVGLAAVTFLIALWQYWVLTRPDVRELFYRAHMDASR